MTKARPKEGPRAPLFYLLPLLPGWVGFAAAQTVELSDLEICAGLETPELKLACYEAIVATGRRGAAAAADANTAMAPEPAVATAEPETTAESEPELAVTDSVERAPIASQAAQPQQPVTESTPEEPAIDSFGSEHLEKESADEPAVLEATVVDVTKTRRGSLVFYLDNGQVWRQIEPRYFPYPRDGEFDVTISTGMMGAYRLQVEGAGRRVTIRRVK